MDHLFPWTKLADSRRYLKQKKDTETITVYELHTSKSKTMNTFYLNFTTTFLCLHVLLLVLLMSKPKGLVLLMSKPNLSVGHRWKNRLFLEILRLD